MTVHLPVANLLIFVRSFGLILEKKKKKTIKKKMSLSQKIVYIVTQRIIRT